MNEIIVFIVSVVILSTVTIGTEKLLKEIKVPNLVPNIQLSR